MPYEPHHSACRIPPLLSTEKPDFESRAVRKSVMQEMRELIKFREIAREQEGLECELGMEEMLSRVHLPILRQAITELAAADSEKDKDDQKIGMGNILTRTIKSMKGMYAEAKEDEDHQVHEGYVCRGKGRSGPSSP